MTKRELLQEYKKLCGIKKIELEGVYENSNKSAIQNAIDCLNCPDEILNDYMTVIKLKYPNTYRTISGNGDFKTHRYNRLYVYNTAKLLLSA